MPATYEGGCHCGRVRFRVTADLDRVTYCNCSMCTKKGFLHLIVPPEQFELVSGKDDLATYTFNTGVAKLAQEAIALAGDAQVARRLEPGASNGGDGVGSVAHDVHEEGVPTSHHPARTVRAAVGRIGAGRSTCPGLTPTRST